MVLVEEEGGGFGGFGEMTGKGGQEVVFWGHFGRCWGLRSSVKVYWLVLGSGSYLNSVLKV